LRRTRASMFVRVKYSSVSSSLQTLDSPRTLNIEGCVDQHWAAALCVELAEQGMEEGMRRLGHGLESLRIRPRTTLGRLRSCLTAG
jgi:hypothetical protein